MQAFSSVMTDMLSQGENIVDSLNAFQKTASMERYEKESLEMMMAKFSTMLGTDSIPVHPLSNLPYIHNSHKHIQEDIQKQIEHVLESGDTAGALKIVKAASSKKLSSYKEDIAQVNGITKSDRLPNGAHHESNQPNGHTFSEDVQGIQ